MSRWRPALRIARRTVRRNLGRSLLIASLVAVPVAGATLVDIVYRTGSNPERLAYQHMAGGHATIVTTPYEQLHDGFVPEPFVSFGQGAPQRDPDDVDLAAMLPTGTTLVPVPLTFYNVRVERGAGTTAVEVLTAELGHALTENRARLVSGRWPERPDEVLVTAELADRLDLLDAGQVRRGATVTLDDGPTLGVTGLGLDPSQIEAETIFTAPESAATDSLLAQGRVGENWRLSEPGNRGFVAEFPAATDVDALWPALAAEGVSLLPREAFLHPERYRYEDSGLYIDADVLMAAALVTLVVGLGLLEVVLLAGAAFAVGARRQVRDLGLVASNGGTARQVRRIVLAQGLVLGVIGAVLGVAAGAALAVAGRPLWESFGGELIESWHFGPVEIAIAAGVGVVSGIAAALVPAVTAARLLPVDALARRFRATPLTVRLPRIGIAMIAVGAVGALLVSRLAAGDLADYGRRVEEMAGTGQSIGAPPTVEAYVALQLLGAVLAVAGLILTISFLVTALARRMRGWPLSARYAARDAARHRHRTAPAVAAIMIVVAGATGLSFGLAGTERANELRYRPSLPEGVLAVSHDVTGHDIEDPGYADALLTNIESVAAALPGASVTRRDIVVNPSGVPAHEPLSSSPIWLEPAAWWYDEHCVALGSGYGCSYSSAWLAVASPELFESVTGHGPDRASQETLDDGGIVVLSPGFVEQDGTVVIRTWDFTGSLTDTVRLPAHVAGSEAPRYGQLPSAFVTADTAAEHGWQVVTAGAYVRFDAAAVTDDELDAAHDAADAHGYWSYVERGPGETGTAFLYLALVGGVALVTLIGVGITAALSAAEGRADLATMAAVGAPPRRRRALAGWQALVVGGIGTALGLSLGAFYAYLIWPATGAPDFLVPWQNVALIGVAVPLLAVLVAMAFTPSRLPMLRRIE